MGFAGPSDPQRSALRRLAPWRDNAYLAFTDFENEVFGCAHVSTSPNAEGRRARVSMSIRGRTAEVVEELEPGTFASESIEYDLDGRVTVDSADLVADLRLDPVGVPGDYTAGEVIPPLVESEPLQHFQQVAAVSGTATVRGETVSVAGAGIRDRTWGYRDESAMMVEYVAIILNFRDRGITVMSFVGPDGRKRADGFLLGAESAEHAEITNVTRDGSGLVAGFGVDAGDSHLDFRTVSRPGGFWVPMGPERTGPTMSAYDEFVEVRTSDGEVARGIIEQGIVRQLC